MTRNSNNLYIELFKQQCLAANNEEEIRVAGNIFISTICQQFGLTGNIHNEIHSVYGGRADSIYSNILFEYKKPNHFRTNDGIEEALRGRKKSKTDRGLFHYLINFSLEQSSDDDLLFENLLLSKVGIAFDGSTFVFCRFKKSRTTINLIDKNKTKSIPDSIQRIRNLEFETTIIKDIDSGIRRTILYIRSTDRKMLTSDCLLESFSAKSKITSTVIPYLYELLNSNITSNSRIATLYNEWQRIFGDIYEKQETDFVKHISAIRNTYSLCGDIDVKRALFTIQTYYSIVIKILIYNLFSSLQHPYAKNSNLTQRSDILRLFKGQASSFNKYIDNFFEIHFFEWFLFSENLDIYHINLIIEELDTFETTASVIKPEIVGDVLKKTYEDLMPKDIRHLMGEYYTVDWLVDFSIEKSGYNYDIDKRVLDPTCGSGAFLTHLIKGFIKSNQHKFSEQELICKIINNFIGFDINPIAVISAKGNYILSLGDITQLNEAISIPIYMCDSILVPTVHAKQKENSGVIEITTSVGEFTIPVLSDRSKSDYFLKTISDCVLTDYTTFEEFLGRLYSENKLALNKQEQKYTETLFNKLITLHMSGKDGFWPIILKNSFAPLFLKGKFDYIMGNPPWIGWKSMSSSYRKLTLNIWLSYGIFEKNAYDKITSHDDFAMAVTYVAMDHYLNDKGIMTFVLPQTFVKSLKGGEGFRKFSITRDGLNIPFAITAVYDMLKINPFKGVAANKTSVYIFQKGIQMKYPMTHYYECSILPGNKLSSNLKWDQIKSLLHYDNLWAKPINVNIRSPWLTLKPAIVKNLNRYFGESVYKGRKGIEPCGAKGIYLVSVNSKHNNKLNISNLIERSRLKEAIELGVHTDFVDEELIYPMIGGRNIDKWGINSYLYMIVPHNSNGDGIYRGIEESVLKTKYSLTYKWLFYFKKLLFETRVRSGKFFDPKQFPWYRLDNVGEYTFMPYKVLWKEQSQEMKCVVVSNISDQYISNKTVVTDSKVLSVSLNDKDEAHYLCAVLNSSDIDAIVQGYTINTNRGIDIVKNINIPKYNKNNNNHKELAALSIDAHEAYIDGKIDKLNDIQKKIDDIVRLVFEDR